MQFVNSHEYKVSKKAKPQSRSKAQKKRILKELQKKVVAEPETPIDDTEKSNLAFFRPEDQKFLDESLKKNLEHKYNLGEFDFNGYDFDGFDVNGINVNGFNVNEFNPNGFDVNGFDMNGFDKNGCDKYGNDLVDILFGPTDHGALPYGASDAFDTWDMQSPSSIYSADTFYDFDFCELANFSSEEIEEVEVAVNSEGSGTEAQTLSAEEFEKDKKPRRKCHFAEKDEIFIVENISMYLKADIRAEETRSRKRAFEWLSVETPLSEYYSWLPEELDVTEEFSWEPEEPLVKRRKTTPIYNIERQTPLVSCMTKYNSRKNHLIMH